MRSHSLQPHGASVAWETLETSWMHKQAIWAVKPSSRFIQRAADMGVPVFADVLDVYHTADARDPWHTQLFGYRSHPLVTWVGTSPSAVQALMTLGNTIFVPHQGDHRVKPRVFVPTAAPIYWGANEYFQPWMAEVTRVFGTYVLEKGPNYNPCGPMLNLRGGRWATRANSKLKPQVKLANAILADVPLISTDVEAGQSLAELWNIPYILVSTLQEAKDRIEEVPLILIRGGS